MENAERDAVSKTGDPRNFRYDCENFAGIAKNSQP